MLRLKALSKHTGYFSANFKNYLLKITNIQKSLLISAIKTVKTGGTIVYSTCSITVEENEKLIDSVIKEYPVIIDDCISWNIPSIRKGLTAFNGTIFDNSLKKSLRIYPFPFPMEGFYIVKLKKTDSLKFRPTETGPNKIPLHDYKDIRIKEILESNYDYYGIDPEIFSNNYFLINKEKIWMTTREREWFPGIFLNAGLPLFVKKFNRWVLTNHGVQVTGNNITKPFIELNETELKELFGKGRLNVNGYKNGYYVLLNDNLKIGSVSVINGIMKIHLPNLFRLII